ncbi:glycosyltransferase [Desulfonema magnum]|uniref:glycosyltransferase n=1 Tax=Desulfonema magnum TaxID=45655 RepID=UPI001A9B40B0|nr:glycosyltransferase [Desulfonema magnum]
MENAILNVNETDTQRILRDFPEVDIPNTFLPENNRQDSCAKVILNRQQDSEALFLQSVFNAQNGHHLPIAPQPPAFSIIIPFYAHLDYLKICLESVALSVRHVPEIPVEILIINDDPNVSEQVLASLIPDNLRKMLRIIDNEKNLGICESLNRAVEAAHYHWLVHLDCDDMLVEKSLRILTSRIKKYPSVRYISSRMLDVDENGGLLRCRLRSENSSHLISHGMVAGHLKAIRKDLFQDIGGYFKIYEGCQDYEFALRASLFEPLLFLPDYLYKYRWHGKTQSVSKAKRQMETTNRIVETYLLTGLFLSASGRDIPIFPDFEGEYASDWQQGFFANMSESHNRPRISVTVRSPFNKMNRRLFIIRLARLMADLSGLADASATHLTF